MKTVLLVSPDEALRSRLLRALGDRSVFTASTDDEALKTIRVTEVEVVVKEASPPIREVPTFIGRLRSICPNAVVINVMSAAETSPDYESAADAADFFGGEVERRALHAPIEPPTRLSGTSATARPSGPRRIPAGRRRPSP